MKCLTIVSLFFLSVSPFSCENDEECIPKFEQEIDNSIVLEPSQSIYNVGDVVILTLKTPSNVNFQNQTVDLHSETGNEDITDLGYYLTGLKDATIDLVDGGNYINTGVSNQGLINPTLFYYSIDNEYRYKIKITFNSPGEYFIKTKAYLRFPKENIDCGGYYVNLKLNEDNAEEFKYFTVQ